MCYSILVAKRICEHGHLNQWTACWAQCETQMAANLQDFEFDRLCDSVDAERFMVIKSHAKRHRATTRPSNCEVCLLLENTESGWSSRRDALVQKLSELKTKESREKILKFELDKANTEGGSSDAVANMEDEHWIRLLDVLATRDELRRDRASFENEKALAINRETVKVASQLLRSRPWSTFHGVETRKFFLGHFQEDEANFKDFEEGAFDENLIVDYTPAGPPECSFRTRVGFDLSPPGGNIGYAPVDQVLDLWREQEQRVTVRRH